MSDAGGISTWFPGIEQSSAFGSTRSCTLAGGMQLEEDIVNVDDALRRFQYRITAGMPVEHHLGTVDVLEDGEGHSLVVYSTEVTPDAIADPGIRYTDKDVTALPLIRHEFHGDWNYSLSPN